MVALSWPTRVEACVEEQSTMANRPNILFVMTDQQRFDTVSALGNEEVYTPNLDRLVRRGVSFSNAYSTCPVCVPARYTIMSGCEPPTTRVWKNMFYENMHRAIERQCGAYLPEALRTIGYRTFGIGKFHTFPWDAPLGFETQLHSEELYDDAAQRTGDSYASYIAREHPEYRWIDALMGERTEMYYMPQMSPLPPELTVEAWAADRAVDLVRTNDTRPWFGFVSFIGPHPPFGPPQPFNRIYDPDRMSSPVRGRAMVDHRDQQIPLMNRLIWADDISDSHARVLKARYYGEITYIDWCIGKLLDAVERSGAADNTLICFFSDHGEHLGDHNAWQKESYFEVSARVPLLVSWPRRITPGIRDELVCLTDLFGLATTAAGHAELREGVDLLSLLGDRGSGREALLGYYGLPGQREFKIMIRQAKWKVIYFSNGGRSQVFNLQSDPHELDDLSESETDAKDRLMDIAVRELKRRGCYDALEGGGMKELPFADWQAQLAEPPLQGYCPTARIYQFDRARGIRGFPRHPKDVLEEYGFGSTLG